MVPSWDLAPPSWRDPPRHDGGLSRNCCPLALMRGRALEVPVVVGGHRLHDGCAVRVVGMACVSTARAGGLNCYSDYNYEESYLDCCISSIHSVDSSCSLITISSIQVSPSKVSNIFLELSKVQTKSKTTTVNFMLM